MDQHKAAVQLADQYVATGNASAVVLAGSLGRGRGDEFSDVELDVYWATPPSDDQRTAPTTALLGHVTKLWPYDADDAEWAEDVRVHGVDVTISGFAVDEIDRWIGSFAEPSSPHVDRQLRMSAIHEGETLYGDQVVAGWRTSGTYSDGLAVATAASFLNLDRLSRWRLWPALVRRDDPVMLQRACSDVTEVLLGTMCALNRIYIEHPSFKWSRHLAGRFTRAPTDFADRLFAALTDGPFDGAADLHALLRESAQLVASDLPKVDISAIDDVLHGRR